MSTPDLEDDDELEVEPEGRFQGSASHWRSYTAHERALAASLDELQARDLSIHLYNAHAISAAQYDDKVTTRLKSWHSKESWYGDNIAKWRPTEQWTAWPLNVDEVPRSVESGSKLSYTLDNGTTTHRKVEQWQPGDDLEEELIALVLKRAKTQLAEQPSLQSQTADTIQRQQSDETAFLDTNSLPPEMLQDRGLTPEGKAIRTLHSAPQATSDDDYARRILSPSVRHIMSEFDNLLIALHKSRKGHTITYNAPEIRRTNRAARRRRRSSHVESSTNSTSDSVSEGLSSPSDRDVTGSAALVVDSKPLHTRDWSEVLALAAMVGWNQDVVQTAARRCKLLFGENMSFRVLQSAQSPQVEAPTVLQNRKPKKRRKNATATGHALYCPVEGCNRVDKPFDSTKRIHEHLRRKHGWSKDDCANRRAQLLKLDNDEDEQEVSHTAPAHQTGQRAHDELLMALNIDLRTYKHSKSRRKVP